MSPRVGVGFARIGNDLDAERRRGVAAFGFGLEGFSGGGESTEVVAIARRCKQWRVGRGMHKPECDRTCLRSQSQSIYLQNKINKMPSYDNKNTCHDKPFL